MKLFTLATVCALFTFTSCSKVGKPAPAFNVKSIEGSMISSDSLKGKIIVANVWATWCPMCIREIPELNRLQAKYANDTNIVFIAFCDDQARDMRIIFDSHPFNYIQVPDAGQLISKLKTKLVKTFPQNLIINSEMDVVFEVTEEYYDIYDMLDRQLQDLLQYPDRYDL